MSDPVWLPTCTTVMDRCMAELQISTNGKCPFTNKPLKKEDLVSHTELKAEIEEFCVKHGIYFKLRSNVMNCAKHATEEGAGAGRLYYNPALIERL